MLVTDLVEQTGQKLQIPLPNFRSKSVDLKTGKSHLSGAMAALHQHRQPLQIADYLLAHHGNRKRG